MTSNDVAWNVRMNTVMTRMDMIDRITLFRNSSMCTFIPLISDIQISYSHIFNKNVSNMLGRDWE